MYRGKGLCRGCVLSDLEYDDVIEDIDTYRKRLTFPVVHLDPPMTMDELRKRSNVRIRDGFLTI